MKPYTDNAVSVDVLHWLKNSSDISLPVQSRSRMTFRRIVDQAIELFLSKGYATTTIDDIAEASSTSTGAIYSRFRDKNAILVAVVDAYYLDRFQTFDDFFDHFIEREDHDWRELVREYVHLLIRYFRSDEKMIGLIESVRQDNPQVAELTSRLNIVMVDRLTAALSSCGVRQDADFAYSVKFFHATFRNAMAMTVLHTKSPLGAQLDIHAPEFESENMRFALNYFSSVLREDTAGED